MGKHSGRVAGASIAGASISGSIWGVGNISGAFLRVADERLADGGGVDLAGQLDLTPVPDVGAPLNTSFFLDPVP